MAGRSARHMRTDAQGGRPGRSRRRVLAAALACALAAVALGAVLVVSRGGAGGQSSPAAAPALENANASNGTLTEATTAGNASAPDSGDSASPQGEDASDGAPGRRDGAEAANDAPTDGAQGDAAPEGDQRTKTAPEVEDAVEPLVDGASGTVSVAYVSLGDAGDACYLQADRQVRSASMIKLAVLAEYLREEDAGVLSGDQTYTLKASDIVGGTGSLQGRGAGYATTLDDLARLMICESDNVAANVLIDRMGMDAVNVEASSLGLSSTVLERKMMDTAAMAAGRDNYTSARDVARVLDLIGTGKLVSKEASAKALGWLEQQSDRSGIPAGLPPGTTVGNKTGSLESARHDGAIVLGKSPYVLVVLTDGMGADAANGLISQVSRAVWQTVG